MSNRVPSRSRAPPTGYHQDSYQRQQDVNATLPSNNRYVHQYSHSSSRTPHHTTNVNVYRNSYTNAGGVTTVDTGLSDDTYTDTYYEYYNDSPHYQNNQGERTCYSEDSGSTRLPLYESDDGTSISRNNLGYMERTSQNRRSQLYRERSSTSSNTGRDLRKVYPNTENPAWGRIYQEIPSSGMLPPNQVPQVRAVPIPNFSNRPQSSLSSAIGSTVVDGCGGKCQTCENVCYFFLQLVFTMGILIGISLCIAGTVLRKSAAKNLQVLVYIGVMVSLVSALLLGIQCNARKNAKNRKKALWTAKRAPIPMDTLNIHGAGNVELPQQQPLMLVQENRTQRIVQVPQVSIDIQRQRNFTNSADNSVEEPGIPWWRRRDLHN